VDEVKELGSIEVTPKNVCALQLAVESGFSGDVDNYGTHGG